MLLLLQIEALTGKTGETPNPKDELNLQRRKRLRPVTEQNLEDRCGFGPATFRRAWADLEKSGMVKRYRCGLGHVYKIAPKCLRSKDQIGTESAPNCKTYPLYITTSKTNKVAQDAIENDPAGTEYVSLAKLRKDLKWPGELSA